MTALEKKAPSMDKLKPKPLMDILNQAMDINLLIHIQEVNSTISF